MSLFVHVVMLVASHGARRAHLRRVIFVWDIDRASRGGLIRQGGDAPVAHRFKSIRVGGFAPYDPRRSQENKRPP